MFANSFEPWALPAEPGESEERLQQRRHRAYFDWQIEDNEAFWQRVGQDLDLANARVLDLGCGHGALSVDLAKREAAEVIGLDLDAERIAFARRHVPVEYPSLSARLHFSCQDIARLDSAEPFDFVFSKDTFEHILDLRSAVGHIRRLLKPGGRLVVGTSPLYYSPFGDHGEYLGDGIPWLGVVPEPLLFRLASWKNGRPIRRAGDVGLNKMTPAEFRSLFAPPAWRIDAIHYNRGDKKLLSALQALRTLPGVEKYFTVSIYAVITRL